MYVRPPQWLQVKIPTRRPMHVVNLNIIEPAQYSYQSLVSFSSRRPSAETA